MVTALTAAAFLAMSPAALTNDAVAVFNRADWLESVTDSRAPGKDARFEWDVAGNLKRQQTAARDRRFTWDVKQTLTRVEDNGIEAGRYDYGADGLRSKRVTALESVEYVLDGMQVLVEADGSNSAHPAKRRYHYGRNALAVTDISGATRTTKALHLDALGSPSTETTQAGVVAAVRQYDAWGQYRNGTAPGSTDIKLGYTGHQYDMETGLVYANARYYDPDYGRFLSRDSFPGDLTSPMSLQRYLYAHGNPLRYTDPTGRCIFQSCKELWNEMTAPEAPTEPPPTTPVVVAPPKPETTFDWEASQDKKMRDRFDDYLYRQEPPTSGDAADILQWRQQRANARGAIRAMETVNDVSHWYLREVAAPYLIAEGGGMILSKVGGATVKALGRDLALQSKAAAQVARTEVNLMHAEAREALATTVAESRATASRRSAASWADVELASGDLLTQTMPRTEGLANETSLAFLRETGAFPGREGVALTDSTVAFSDIYKLSEQLKVEVGISRETVDGSRRFVLRSGSYTSVRPPPLVAGNRSIGHVHLPSLPGEPGRVDLPSRADMRIVDDLWERALAVDPRAPAPPSRVIWGPSPGQQTPFGPTTR